MIHSMPSFETRLGIVRKFIGDFGLAAYCGFGRHKPEEMPDVLADHLAALELKPGWAAAIKKSDSVGAKGRIEGLACLSAR
jgi:hypothetical protein